MKQESFRPREREEDHPVKEDNILRDAMNDFEARYPDLAEAMTLAGQAQRAVQAYDAATSPQVEYSIGSGTQIYNNA
jgi:hypothetical protein